MRHPIVRYAPLVIAVLFAVALGISVIKHVADAFEPINEGLDSTSASTDLVLPIQPASPDSVYLTQVRDALPGSGQVPDADLLDLAFAVQKGWLAGMTHRALVDALVEGSLPRVEAGNVVRLVIAVYCPAGRTALFGTVPSGEPA